MREERQRQPAEQDRQDQVGASELVRPMTVADAEWSKSALEAEEPTFEEQESEAVGEAEPWPVGGKLLER